MPVTQGRRPPRQPPPDAGPVLVTNGILVQELINDEFPLMNETRLDLLRQSQSDSSILNEQQHELVRRYSMKNSLGSSSVQREKVDLQRLLSQQHLSSYDFQSLKLPSFAVGEEPRKTQDIKA